LRLSGLLCAVWWNARSLATSSVASCKHEPQAIRQDNKGKGRVRENA
jgi:hypothetical protein